MGRPERVAPHQGRQAPRRADGGPSARVRIVRRNHPGGSLRRRRGPDLRRRLARADRMDRLQGELPPPRASLSGPRVPLREDEDRLAGLPRLRAGCAADRHAAPVPTDARRGRRGAVRRSGLAIRAQARRDPRPRRDGDGWHGVPDAAGTRRHVPVPRHPHDPRARRPGERGPGRRDRGGRGRWPDLLRTAAATDEPAERTGDQEGREADPRRVRGLRPPLARRARHHRAGPRGTARAPRAGRRGGPPAAADELRGGRRRGVRRGGAGARPRGCGREAEGIEVRPGQALAGLEEDQADLHPGLRDPGMDAGPGRTSGELRRLARRCDRRTARCGGSVRSERGSTTRCWID